MKQDAVSVAATIVIASFVIDRLKTGILFLMAGTGYWKRNFIDPDSKRKRKQQVLEFCLTGALVLATLLFFPDLRLLQALGISTVGIVDFAFTWLALTTGADQLGDLLKGGARAEPEPKPLQITGDVRLIDDGKTGSAK